MNSEESFPKCLLLEESSSVKSLRPTKLNNVEIKKFIQQMLQPQKHYICPFKLPMNPMYITENL